MKLKQGQGCSKRTRRRLKRRGKEGGTDGCVAQQSGQSITVPKRVPERLSNQFWIVSSLVAIKRRTECLGRIAKEVCRPRDGESKSRGEWPRLKKKTRRGKMSNGRRVKRAVKEA